jgi:hypothetical protein
MGFLVSAAKTVSRAVWYVVRDAFVAGDRPN